jgi:uncharacterized protein YegL
VPCALLLDISNSMSGAPIAALNDALKVFQADLQDDPLAQRRVELAVVTFGGGVSVQPFVSAQHFEAPRLVADGTTPLGEAVTTALEMVKARKAHYRAQGVPYYRPWMLLITDGEPTDAWHEAARQIQAEVAAKGLLFFAVGVANANMQVLGLFTDRVLKLDGLKFRGLFQWLSQSHKSVAASRPSEQAVLPQVTGFAAPV